jgi:predicted TIM-barrel fold metal-dependent hydrolase
MESGSESESILADMGHNGVSMTVLVPSDFEIAVENQSGNDRVLKLAAQHEGVFAGMATVNPWYGKKAIAELRRAAGNGAVGLKLHPVLQGFALCDPLVHPVIEEARTLNLAVYAHTGSPAYAEPLQLAELARTFPDVRFILGHGGSTDFKADALAAAQLAENIVIETSWTLPERLLRLVDVLGAHRVMFGSDAPYSSLKLELANHRSASLDPVALSEVMGGTARRILCVRP